MVSVDTTPNGWNSVGALLSVLHATSLLVAVQPRPSAFSHYDFVQGLAVWHGIFHLIHTLCDRSPHSISASTASQSPEGLAGCAEGPWTAEPMMRQDSLELVLMDANYPLKQEYQPCSLTKHGKFTSGANFLLTTWKMTGLLLEIKAIDI